MLLDIAVVVIAYFAGSVSSAIVVCRALGAEDPRMVNGASYVLGYARWEPAVPYLNFVAGKDRADVSPTAIWALGQIGSEDALEMLHPMLIQRKRPEWIAGALGDIGALSSLELLVPMLWDPTPGLRFLASA